MSYNPNNPNGQATKANSGPVVIASDQAASIASDGTNMALMVGQAATNFVFSTVNSTTSQLAASATFTGTIESVVNQQSYSILLTSDQPGTLTLNQLIDAGGTRLAQTTAFAITAGTPFARSGVMNGNYAQVTFQNTGASTTTTLRIDTAYGTIPSATALNNAPSAINEINGTAISLGSKVSASSFPVVIASDQATLNTNRPDLFITGQAAQTALVNNIIPATAGATATDASGYRSGTVQLIAPAGTYTTGAVIFEGSNDNINFQTVPVYSQLITTGTPIVAAITLVTTTPLIYSFPINFRYIRVRISTAISGASAQVQAFTRLSQAAWTPAVFQVAQNTAASLATTATIASGTVTTVSTVTSVTAVAALNSVATTNGLSIGTVVTTATPATNSIKATAGRLHHISIGNPNASAVYLKIWNVAAPTLGTTAANMNYLIPATSQTTIPINDVGLYFSTAIVVAVTGGISLTDNTAISAGCAVSYSWI